MVAESQRVRDISRDLASVPHDLLRHANWVRYRLGDPDPTTGKRSKVPWHPVLDYRVSVVKPNHWSTFEIALANVGQHGTNGLGYVFAKADGYQKIEVTDPRTRQRRSESDDEYALRLEQLAQHADPFTGIDLDDSVTDAGTLEPWAARFIQVAGTYSEMSVSGTGVHMICRGVLPGRGLNFREPPVAVEAYSRGRFFTVTGEQLPDGPSTIEPRQEVLAKLTRLTRTTRGRQSGQHVASEGGKITAHRHDFLARHAARLHDDGLSDEVMFTILRTLRDQACGQEGRVIEDAELLRIIAWTATKPRRQNHGR